MTKCQLFIDRDSSTGVFPGKMSSDCRKNQGCEQKKTEGTSSAIFGVETAAKCCQSKRYADRARWKRSVLEFRKQFRCQLLSFSFVIIMVHKSVHNFSVYKVFCFAAEHNKDEVHQGKFRNLNFSLSTKKTTEYSFELFLSIYRYEMFFLKYKTSVL